MKSLRSQIIALPCEIRNKIIAYTYSPQSPSLLADIQYYTESMAAAQTYYQHRRYNSMNEGDADSDYFELNDLFIDDIIAYVSGHAPSCYEWATVYKLIQIWRRLYVISDYYSDDKICDHLSKFLFEKRNMGNRIRILWGLMTPNERYSCLWLSQHRYNSGYFNRLPGEIEEEEQDFDY